MPVLAAIPWLLPVITAATAATATGVSIYEGDQAQSNEQQAQKTAQQAQAQQQLIQKQEALTAAGPNAQAQTSGSLTGPAGQSFLDILAGYPGQTGTSSPSSPTNAVAASQSPANAAPVNYQNILEQLRGLTGGGSQFSGGSENQTSPQYSPFSLAWGY